MESDDEYEIDLPKFPRDNFKVGEVDLGKIRRDQHHEFQFDMPENVQTEGYQENTTHYAKSLHPLNIEQMKFEFSNVKLDHADMLSTMFGDFSDIEPLMDDVGETNGGVKKRVVRPGTGKSVNGKNMVKVHFMVGAEQMDDLIESTYQTRSPKRYRLNAGEMLPVMDIGVATMRVGEIAKFLATCEYGYGKLGVPLSDGLIIPKDVRVMMQIELLETYLSEKDTSIANMSWAERQALPFEQLFIYASEMKTDGNREFKTTEYGRAIKCYLASLDCIKDMEAVSEEEQYRYNKLRQQVCNNLAHTYFKVEKFKRAFKYAESGTEVPVPGMLRAKSHYWCAKALFQLGRFEPCFEHIQKADFLHPDSDIRQLKAKVEKKLQLDLKKEKDLCTRMMNAKISSNDGK